MAQEIKKPLYTLYEALKADNYDVPDTYESFERTLTAPGKEGTDNRVALYGSLRANNYDVPDTYESFARTLFKPVRREQTTVQSVNAGGETPAGSDPVKHDASPAGEESPAQWTPTDGERRAMVRKVWQLREGAEAMFAGSQEWARNMANYHKGGRSRGFRTVEGLPQHNEETGKLEKTYLTPDGGRTADKVVADMSSFGYRQATAVADMSVGAQMRRAEAELRKLQEQRTERMRRIAEETKSANDGGLFGAYGQAVALGQVPEQDKEIRALDVAIRQRTEQLKDLQEERDRQAGKDVGFWRGFGRAAGDIRSWDFGISDLRDAATMLDAEEYLGKDASEGEKQAGQGMLKALYDKGQTERSFGENASFLNRAGVMTGYMPSFMLDFALTGGGFEAVNFAGKAAARGTAKLIGKEALKEMTEIGVKEYAKKYGVRGVGRMAENWAIKALGTTADELLVRAPLMTNTVQAGSTVADIVERKLGDVEVDDNGNYRFTNDKTWGSAVWQGEANAIIENYSEMFGTHLDGVAPVLAATFGGKRISGMLARANASDFGKILATTRRQFQRLGVSDYFGEVAEEYYGQLWRTMLGLDDAYTSVPVEDGEGNQVLDAEGNPMYERKNLLFTGKFHGDIWGGMALSMGLMGAGKYAMTGMTYAGMKHGVNKADRVASQVFSPQRWEPIREVIDNTDNEHMGELAESMVGDRRLTEAECAAVLNYMERSMNLRGLNLGSLAQGRGGVVNPDESELSDSYIDGYEAVSAMERNDAQNMYEYQRQRLVAELGSIGEENVENILAEVDENPVEALMKTYDEGLRNVMRDYANAKVLRDGVIRRVNDDIDEQIAQSDAAVDARVNRDTGKIQPVVMGLDNRYAEVVGGKLAVRPDGTIDRENSDESLIVRDAVTGELAFTDPKSIVAAMAEADPEEEKAQAAEQIRQGLVRSAVDAMNGTLAFNPGDVVAIGPDGQQVTVVGQVTDGETGAVIEDQVVVQLEDGTQSVYTKAELQKWADEANRRRVEDFERERTSGGGAGPVEQEPQQRQFVLNDEFTILDEEGNSIRGSVSGELDADGRIEVYTEEPVNGNRVNRFTPEELEGMLETYNGEEVVREQVPEGMAETAGQSQSQAQPQVNGSALSLVPVDEQGHRRFEDVDAGTAWDALVEQAKGNEAIAVKVAERMIAERQKELDAAEEALTEAKKVKPDEEGENESPLSVEELVAAEEAVEATIAEAQTVRDHAGRLLEHWKEIADTRRRREQELPSAPAAEPIEAEAPLASGTEGRVGEAMPMRTVTERGVSRQEPDYLATSPERAHAYIYGEAGLTREEADTHVAVLAKKAAEAVEKHSKKEPKIGASIALWREEKAKWEAEGAELRRVADFWEAVKAEQKKVTDAEASEREAEEARRNSFDKRVREVYDEVKDVPEAVEALERMQPRDIHEAAAYLLSGQKVLWSNEGVKVGAKAETGFGEGERRRLFGLFATSEKGGRSLQSLAEDPMRELCEEYGVPYDEQEARNALIEIITGARTVGDIRNYIANRRMEEALELAKAYHEHEEAQYDEYCRKELHMPAAEVEAYEEYIEADLEERDKKFAETEYYGYLADEMAAKAEGTKKGSNNGESGTDARRGSSSGDRGIQGDGSAPAGEILGGGDEVLPGARTDKPGGEAEAGGRPDIQPGTGLQGNGTASTVASDAPGRIGDGPSVVGRSLSKEEASETIAAMEASAEVAPVVDLTIENWDAQFGESGIVNTPIGEVKMGENQFTKLMRQGRNGKLGMVKPTLENPDIIIEDTSEAKGGDVAERSSSYVFVKAFVKSDGTRYYYFTSVTVSKEGREVVVSNQEKRRNVLTNLLMKGKLVWKHADNVSPASDVAAGLYSSQGGVSEPASEGTDAPQTNVPEDKGSDSATEKQGEGEKSLGVGKKRKGARRKGTDVASFAADRRKNESLSGVMHSGGFRWATDGEVMVREKVDYPEELEGVMLDKKGNKVEGHPTSYGFEQAIKNTESGETIGLEEVRNLIDEARKDGQEMVVLETPEGPRGFQADKLERLVDFVENHGGGRLAIGALGHLGYAGEYADAKIQGHPVEGMPSAKKKSGADLDKSGTSGNFEAEEKELTESDINSIDDPAIGDELKDGARDWLSGERDAWSEMCYKTIQDYVRNSRNGSGESSVDADEAQLAGSVSEEDGPGVREGGSRSGATGRRDGDEDVAGVADGIEDSPRGGGALSGERGPADVPGRGSVDGGSRTGGNRRVRSGGNRRDGSDVRKPGGQRSSNGSPRNDGGRPSESSPVSKGEETAQGLIDDALDTFRDIFKNPGMTEPGRLNDVTTLLAGLGVNAVRFLGATAKLGCGLVLKGYYKYVKWQAEMHKALDPVLGEYTDLTDEQIAEFIRSAWDMKMTYRGVRKKVSEWAAELEVEELRRLAQMDIAEKRKMQKVAEGTEVVVGNLDNIRETLPFLLPAQHEDVEKAELQFFTEEHADREHGYGKGFLFTNGTGTGKTYTGLGIVKRFLKQGKGRVLIVTVNDTKISDWIKDASNLGIKAKQLADTKSKGAGVVVTQYANLRQNYALLEDEFDLIVYDESHKLMENQQGEVGSTATMHHLLANRDAEAVFTRELEVSEFGRKCRALKEEAERLNSLLALANRPGSLLTAEDRNKLRESGFRSVEAIEEALKKAGEQAEEYDKEFDKRIETLMGDDAAVKRAEAVSRKTKTVFLSATPFNTPSSLDYAEGYIFSYPQNKEGESRRDKRNKFLKEKFGKSYRRGAKGDMTRMSEGQITDPEAVEEEEISYSNYLQDTLHTMSGRMLDSAYDYSRSFPKFEMPEAKLINTAMSELNDSPLKEYFKRTLFDYNYSTAFWEIIKTGFAIPRIREHLALGRKVVIFHRRKNSNQDVDCPFAKGISEAMSSNNEMHKRLAREFAEKYRDLFRWEASLDYTYPHERLVREFATDEEVARYNQELAEWREKCAEAERQGKKMPRHPRLHAAKVGVFNGDETKGGKQSAVDTFNASGSGMDVLVVQVQSGKEGISLHDTDGKHQRVMLSLALPQSPIEFIQAEGRIYRVGNKSDAIFEYPLLGIDRELYDFAMKINGRSQTSENLAMGDQARGLRDSITRGALGSMPIPVTREQGKGGKMLDSRATQEATGFDHAMSKWKEWRDGETGKPYSERSIPDPLAVKLMEWAGLERGETVLVAYAGEGSAARYAPASAKLIALESDSGKLARLAALLGGGGRKILGEAFMRDEGDTFSTNNKADVVVVKTRTGVIGSGLSMRRRSVVDIQKALQHTEDSGRVVAIVPTADLKGENGLIEVSKDWTRYNGVVIRSIVNLPGTVFSEPASVVVLDRNTEKTISQVQARQGVQTIDVPDGVDAEAVLAGMRETDVTKREIDRLAKAMKRCKKALTPFLNSKLVSSSKMGRSSTKDAWVTRSAVYVHLTKYLVPKDTSFGSASNGISIQFDSLSDPRELEALAKKWKGCKALAEMEPEEYKAEYGHKLRNEAQIVEAHDLMEHLCALIEAATGKTATQLENLAEGRVENAIKEDMTIREFKDVFKTLDSESEEIEALAERVFAVAAGITGLQFRMAGAGAFDSHNVMAHYAPGRNIIELNKDAFNSIRFTDAQKAQCILHETIHAVTCWAMAKYKNASEEERKEMGALGEACGDIIDVFKAINNDSFRAQLQAGSKLRDNAMYGLNDEYEMLAEMANPVFRAALKAKRLWRQLVNGIKKLFGIDVIDSGEGETTAFEVLNNAINTILENFNPAEYARYTAAPSKNEHRIEMGDISEVREEITSKRERIEKLRRSEPAEINEQERLRQGDGYGAYSDAEVSYMNDPISKVMGKNRFSKKRQAEFAARERQRMGERIKELAERMNLDNVEILTDASQLEGKRAKAKGFYNKRTRKITIVIPNNYSTIDAEQTLLHEAVAHYGLRQLFGKQFDAFLDNVYEAADETIRRKIAEMAAQNGWDFRIATEEYLAGLAEDTNFNDVRNYSGWWSQIKRLFLDMLEKIGFEGFRDKAGVVITDNELRYILWRSYENLAEPGRYRSILGEAADVAKQSELKVGNYTEEGIEAEYAAEPLSETNDTNSAFNEQLERQISGTLPKGHIYQLGRPGKILLSTGVPDLPIQMSATRLKSKASEYGHDFDLSEIKDLVKALQKPMAIFVYGDKTKMQNIILGIESNGKQFIVGLSLNPVVNGKALEINSIRNVFPKDNAEWLNWVSQGKLLYVNKREIQALIDKQRTILADVDYLDLDDVTKVVNNFENPTIEEEELFRPGDFTPRDKVYARYAYESIVKSGAYQFHEAMQDSMLGLKEVYKAVLGPKTRIEEVAGFENAYIFENRMSSMNAGEQHEYFRRYMQPLLKEIAIICGANKRKRRELTDYLMAKHGLERNEYMRAEAIKNKENPDRDFAGLIGLTGEDDWRSAEATAQQWVDDYEASVDTTALWEAINRATKASLEKVYLSGVISKDTYEKILGMYQYYIPLRGWDEKTSDQVYGYLTSKDGPLGGSIMKKAEGRKSKADDPIATIGMMADDAIRQGNRNLMKQRFLNFVLNHPSDLVSVHDLWLEFDYTRDEWRPVFADIEETDTPEEVEQKIEAFEERMEKLRETDPTNYKRGREAQNVPYKVVRNNLREHQVLVKRNGRTFVLTINGNPRAAQALNGLTNPDVDLSGSIGNLLKAASWLNRQLSAFYTTRNPEFVVSNFFRDMLYANNMTWVKESPAYALRFHKNFGRVNPAMMRRLLGKWEKGTLDTGKPLESMFSQFMLNGGETGYTNVRDIESHKKAVASEIRKMSKRDAGRKAWYWLGKQLDLLNRSAENCARFAAFVTSREMGRDIDRSIYDAKEISVNFNKKGSGGKMVNATGQTFLGKVGGHISGLGRAFYVFWNAGIQGMANFGKMGLRHPVKFFGGAIGGLYTLGMVVPMLAQMTGGGDGDDDDRNAYYNLPEYVRRSNICFRVGDNWVTIPLPIEFRAIYGLGELTYGVISGNEHYSDAELSYHIAAQVSQLLPIDVLEGGGGFSPFIPSAGKPVTEAYWMNKSWSGLPIYRETPFNKNDPEWTKAYASTDKHLVDFARWLNETTGGDDFKKGAIDINPAKIEYVLNGTFGGMSTFPNKIKKSLETAFGDREFEWRNMPIASRLIQSGDERTANRKLRNEYYRYSEEHEATWRLFRKYEKAGKNGSAAYAEKAESLRYTPEYLRYEIFDFFDDDIKAHREALNAETDKEKRATLESEMYGQMRQAVNALNDPKSFLDELYKEGKLNDEYLKYLESHHGIKFAEAKGK